MLIWVNIEFCNWCNCRADECPAYELIKVR